MQMLKNSEFSQDIQLRIYLYVDMYISWLIHEMVTAGASTRALDLGKRRRPVSATM